MKPVVSIVIPVYNAEKTLRKCVESLALGTERNIQLILVEDRSADESWSQCETLSKEFPNVVCIQNAENRGVSYTRNQGLARAQGEYVLFVDSDDWVSGNYVKTMLSLAQKHPDSLPICGYHFLDRVNNTRQLYVWDSASQTEETVLPEQYFDLMEKSLLQSLWNKIFRRDVIEKAGIRFDEAQSMGEDFQFVLDYIEAANVKNCVVLNQPLYYYIRYGTSSLMSQFGLIQTEQELARVEQLHRLTGGKETLHRDQMIRIVKQNRVYHVCRNTALRKEEKLQRIEAIMQDSCARAYYRSQMRMYRKEKLAAALHMLKKQPKHVKNRLLREKQNACIRRQRKQLRAQEVSLISQNCIGGVFYHDMQQQFLSPTVNLFFTAEEFVRFVQDLPRYLAMEPEMFWDEEFPIGKLGDVTIHFMHYDTCAQAKDAWQRRKARVQWNKIVVLCSDMEGFDDAVFTQWKRIPYPKVLFTANKTYAQEPGIVYYPEYENKMPDLIPERKFYRSGVLLDTVNQLR